MTQTLAGNADRIKGYTIAVEALGRDASFDPNSQSIVRTEAARLRQELDRYYAEAGRDEPVRIALPRGRYVPVFTRVEVATAASEPTTPAAPEPVVAEAPTALPEPSPEVTPAAEPLPQPAPQEPARGLSRFRVTPAWLAILAVVAYAAFDVLLIDHWNLHRIITAAEEASIAPRPARRRTGEPWLAVEPVAVVGAEGALAVTPDALHARLVNALARFEDIAVVAAPARTPDPAQASADLDYLLVPKLVRAAAGQSFLSVRLLAMPERRVVWHDEIAIEVGDGGQGSAVEPLVVFVTSALLQPFGIIPASERRKRDPAVAPSPYQCTLVSAELARYFDPQRREHTRDCLEAAIRDEPAFALGHVLLARLHYRDHVFGNGGPGSLETALGLARRAVELAPSSARAHYTLMHIQVARGHLERGLAHGERALALNPYDLRVLMQVGGQLVTVGEVDRGLALLQRARRLAVSNPAPLAWSTFLAAFLKDDVAAMAVEADRMPGASDLDRLARALLLARQGDMAGARTALAPLEERGSAFVERPRELLARSIASPAIVDRIVAAIEAITGDGPTSQVLR
ncbi:hypothetical protein [Rhodoplanes sp. SY1]|uniref:hypothetical protein n=1 Tax=Rhodoplanes sp. SY1 TaxID=3166646 RepID=UPI0038B63D5D